MFALITVLTIGLLIGKYAYQLRGEYFVPFPKKGREILLKYFEYYIRLRPDQRKVFERRVQYFIRIKEFIPRQMDQVSFEMKLLIAACAIQLTFGLPRVYLRHFRRILVYPDNYYSMINQTYHKGEVNPRYGIIVLSWKAFVHGYIEKEGINLGLHEMAHALHLENVIMNGESDFIDKRALDRWNELAPLEMERIKNEGDHFFRSYGANDPHELFAVAVENFFERPVEFKSKLPQLYASLSSVLNQDPAINA